MDLYKVFGVDSNLGSFEEVFDDKDRAHGFYTHQLENACFVEIVSIKAELGAQPRSAFKFAIDILLRLCYNNIGGTAKSTKGRAVL